MAYTNAHDLLSGGNVSTALSRKDSDSKSWQGNVLPYLTRLLNNANMTKLATRSKTLIECVEKLEDAVASHTQAEVVDDVLRVVESVVSSKGSGRLSKLLQSAPRFRRKTSMDFSLENNLKEVMEILKPATISSDNVDEIMDDEARDGVKSKKRKRARENNRKVDGESIEKVVKRAIHDLSELVLNSKEANNSSILLRADSSFADCDNLDIILSMALPSIMHFAPAFRHRDVAYALCLSSCPKAPEYIFLMAANCPAVCSCLVAGCVDAYLILVKSQKNSTSVQLRTAISLCCNSIRNIASLSKRVALEVSRTLTSTRSLMVGVQIEILLEINPNAAASMVSKLFSSPQDRFNIENESNRLEIGKNCRHRRKVYDNTFYHLMEQESYKPDVVDVIENESTLIIKKLSNHLTDMISERLVSNIGNEMIILRAIILTLGATPMKNKFDVADNIEMLLKAIDEVIIRDDGTEYNSKYLHYILAFASASFPHLREDCDGKRLCRKIVINILANRDPCDTFVINVTVAIIAKDFSSYCVLMRNLLTNQSKVSTWNIFDESAFGSFLNNILLSDVESELKIICQKSILDKVLLVDPLAFLGAADAGDVNEMELYVLIQTSLKSDDSCEKFCSNEGTVDLLEKTISYTLRKKLPFLSPVDVLVLNENFCRNSLMNNEYLSEFAKLCIYVYYFLRLYEIDRSFPFGVDIFSLSLDKIFNHCQSYRFSEDKFHFYRILCDTIIRVHPSLSSMRKIRKLQLDLVLQQVEGANITIKQVIETTKIAVERNGDESYSYKARVLYFSAKENEDISSSLLDLGVSCALLSSSTSTSPCYTYANLCEDPLVVLKCHLNIWKSNNLCLILLEVFEAILQINEDQLNLKIQSGRDAITAEQYLVSRDTIVVRTLLFLICEPSIEEAGSVYEAKSCRNAILKVLRKIFSQRKGLVFSLIKQDISEEFLNVIVHSVPEAVQDSDLFVSMLQDQSAPIVSRLKVADASFRIVALNINNKVYDEELAQKVVFAGMTVMINSFYIAQGAVGIAAEILRVDDSKVDVCRLCRDTILRMVRHMEKISSHREALKHECSIALAKVSELCKQNEGDRNSLFIRSMSEATTRAINVLGGRVHA